MAHRILGTADGSQTLFSPAGHAYHSMAGAVGEGMHVFVAAGLREAMRERTRGAAGAAGAPDGPGGAAGPTGLPETPDGPGDAAGIDTPLRVLEIGFGSGLNCLLTAREGCPVRYTAVERYPVPQAVWGAMEYAADPLFGAIHRAAWGEWTRVSPAMELLKVEADLTAAELPQGAFDVIYMDAFAPDDQPELWTAEVFRKLFAATAPGGILVTYCAKGDVKRALRAAGYTVRRLPGALGKRHMLRCRPAHG